MYPSGELAKLADRKALVRARIAVHRWECAAAASELARPLALIDRVLQTWRRISPLVKLASVPMSVLAIRTALRKTRGGRLAKVAAALPLVMRTVRLVRQMKMA